MRTQDDSVFAEPFENLPCFTPNCPWTALPDSPLCLHCQEAMEHEAEMERFCNPIGSWILLGVCVLTLLFVIFVVPVLRKMGFSL